MYRVQLLNQTKSGECNDQKQWASMFSSKCDSRHAYALSVMHKLNKQLSNVVLPNSTSKLHQSSHMTLHAQSWCFDTTQMANATEFAVQKTTQITAAARFQNQGKRVQKQHNMLHNPSATGSQVESNSSI